ncbi:MAG: complex I NDUFA9 subunit family protein [Alphaproteobacteria bacterium]
MEIGIVTVFGGAGFIGRHVVQALARAGARVRVVCRRPEEAGACKPLGDVGQIVPIAANIRDPESVAAALAGSDAVVNLVGVLFERGKQSFEAVHHQGAATVARAAVNAGASRLVHLSAIGADVDAPSLYAASKGRGEQAVRNAFPTATLLRPSIVFGPEDSFFNRFASMARLSPALPLIGGGHTRFQPVYVNDVAAAVVRALSDDAATGKTFELGGPAVYSFRRLMEVMLAEIGRDRLLVPWPFWLASIQAGFVETAFKLAAAPIPALVPPPPITSDQVAMLRSDNVVTSGAAGLEALGIAPTALELILPTYLARYRKPGGILRERKSL